MPDKLKAITAQLNEVLARQVQTEKKLTTLEREVKLAKGTREVKPGKPAPIQRLTTQQLVEAVMRLTQEKPRTLQELATALNVDPQAVSNIITALKKQGHRMLNVGEARKAEWYYVKRHDK